jgi:hypothetical protein
MKECKKCGESFPATTDYFHKQNGGKNGLGTFCKPCRNAENKKWRDKQGPCAMKGCTKQAQGQGFCITHYKQLFQAGSLPRMKQLPYRDMVSYSGVHQRVRFAKGNAYSHKCQHCGKTAQHWSWNHLGDWVEGDSNGSLLRYSLDVDAYIPLCAKCHKAFDKAAHG